MPYPRKLLNDGEELALDLRPHWWFFSRHILTAIPLLALFALVVVVKNEVTTWIWVVIALAWCAWLGIKYLDWNATHFVVTTDRVVMRTGVLSKHGVEIPMERISNINFHQGLWERIIGAGDLDIESAGRDGSSHFENVWHPDGVQQEIYRQMEGNARKRATWSHPPAPQAAPQAAPNVADQIRELGDLRDKGLITPEEFETKKAQLLERM